MSRREKILLAAAAMVVFGFVFHTLLNRLLLVPSRRYDTKIQDTIRQINRLRALNSRGRLYRERLMDLGARTFGADEWIVGEQIRDRLVSLVSHSGLNAKDLTVQSPTVTNRTPLGGKEISRRASTRGTLEYVIDFIYLLSADPHLHRLEDLSLTPRLAEGQVELSLRYATLVLPDAIASAPADRRIDPETVADLDSAERQQYQLIAQRDPFRPYIRKKVAARPPAKPKPAQAAGPKQPKPPPLSKFRIIGLPSWGGVQDICVAETDSGRTEIHAIGDELAGGRIVMVDYRPLPMFDDPQIISGSRAVIRIGQEYWAVELGRKLSEKRKLAENELPPQLQQKATTAPHPEPDQAAPPEHQQNKASDREAEPPGKT